MKPAFLLFWIIAGFYLGNTSARAADAPDLGNKKNYIYTLSLADQIRISVYQEDDLTSQTRIDARGRINLPLLGEVAVGGLTVVEAQKVIQEAYKAGRFLRNPQVTVNVIEYAPREVSIQGQI